MSASVLQIRAMCLNETLAAISEVTRRYDEAGDDSLPRVMFSTEAYALMRHGIRREIGFRASRIPDYLSTFPDLLKSRTTGGAIEEEIETALVSAIAEPVVQTVRETLLAQHGDPDIGAVIARLREAGAFFADEQAMREVGSAYNRAVMRLERHPDAMSLSGAMFHIAAAADRLAELGSIAVADGLFASKRNVGPTVLRLRELHDFLDLSLETDGFDALLETSATEEAVAGYRA